MAQASQLASASKEVITACSGDILPLLGHTTGMQLYSMVAPGSVPQRHCRMTRLAGPPPALHPPPVHPPGEWSFVKAVDAAKPLTYTIAPLQDFLMLGSCNHDAAAPTDSVQPGTALALPSWHSAVASKHEQQNGEGKSLDSRCLKQHPSESKLPQMAQDEGCPRSSRLSCQSSRGAAASRWAHALCSQSCQ